MQIVHVDVHVKPEFVNAFIGATTENARKSRLEKGIAQFDLLQDAENSSRFLLVEVYRTPEAAAEHKATPHYKLWRDTVTEMMAQPRASRKFINIEPVKAAS